MPERHTNEALLALTHNLDATLDATNNLIQMVRDDMLTNALFKGRTEQAIIHTNEQLEMLYEIVLDGDGENALVARVREIEFQVKEIEKNIEKILKIIEQSNSKKNDIIQEKSDRHWNLLLHNSPVIVTWLGLAIWYIVQFFLKK